MMIDIGQDVVPMHVDFFRDSAARLYALAALGSRDGEYLRRDDDRKQEDVLAAIPGFDDFYHDLIRRHAKDLWSRVTCTDPIVLPAADDVSLLIKCCAMDAAYIEHQVRYIVNLLSKPRPFKEVILVIDPYAGPLLRQHSHGDMDDLMRKAHELQDEDTVDRVLVAPVDDETMRAITGRWFNIDSAASRTANRAPVVSQLWGFDQVRTRYVLQCDVDVLVGRSDLEHDYLVDMVQACENNEDALGVAFNIPHPDGTINPYAAAPGEYVPEVRCGLLDLHRIRACRPIPNSEVNGSLELTWHRSLQQYQKLHGLRTLRGGNARTFYIHPENHWKGVLQQLAVIRDLVAQGRVPNCQMRQWDLQGEQGDWEYPRRSEDIVFLLKGRNSPKEKLKRCIASLKMQDDQDFGLVVIDDASQKTDTALLQHYLKPFASRSTLIRRHENQGRIPNFMTAVEDICVNPETLVVILDLDDALIHPRTVSMLRDKWLAGHDVVIGGMFRPDKPLKLYHPSFTDVRANWGADVWTHLRAFRKRLFELIPDEYLQIDGEWMQECTDYATMIPMVELAAAPVYTPHYMYWHERTKNRDDEVRNRQERLLKEIMMMKPLTQQQV